MLHHPPPRHCSIMAQRRSAPYPESFRDHRYFTHRHNLGPRCDLWEPEWIQYPTQFRCRAIDLYREGPSALYNLGWLAEEMILKEVGQAGNLVMAFMIEALLFLRVLEAPTRFLFSQPTQLFITATILNMASMHKRFVVYEHSEHLGYAFWSNNSVVACRALEDIMNYLENQTPSIWERRRLAVYTMARSLAKL